MRQRDLTEGQLVTYTSAGGDKEEAGIVSSWNDTAVFVRYWNANTGCFEQTAAGTKLRELKRGGEVKWSE